MKTLTAKLANMRKAQEFTIYPAKPDDETRTIQSGKSIGQFNRTGKGRLCTKGCYFIHLDCFSQPYQFPPEVVEAAFANAPKASADGTINIMDLIS